MSPENIVTLIASGLAFLASVIAVLVSAYNARFRRFARERWWERKAEAYAEVIGSLVSLTYSLDRWQEDEFKILSDEKTEISEDFRNEIFAEYDKALKHIERASTEGNYILSEKAANALSDLIRKLRENTDREFSGWTDWLDSIIQKFESAKNCLKIIREEAKSDLQVK